MLQLIATLLPAPVHRAGLRLAHRARVLWWRWRRPRLYGCRVIALNAAGEVLLVRHSYGPQGWMPPGGGVKRGEDPVLAACRELEEEIGCALAGARVIEETLDDLHGAGNHVFMVGGRCTGQPRPDGREIVAAAFFPPAALPADLAGALAGRLPGWAALAASEEA
ncbi:MAG TPA: NUDIX domain-containing protein [Novosphingobium sp.]|nr:NUDIX domain-containing protein [Novosphingobium sp.]HZV09120.1 NUDIX domain-containing protein [Novosphingobium sp.]